MTQDRRITDKLPGRPLQWDDNASPAAALAAGQAGLAIPAEIAKALQSIAEWNLPATGRTWDDGSPMSYGACWGSNGERDYMRQIASDALSLAAPVAADTEQARKVARYDWLREKASLFNADGYAPVVMNVDGALRSPADDENYGMLVGKSLDNAIDTAMGIAPLATPADAGAGQHAECTMPPEGWHCTRAAGHEGPCAAVPVNEEGYTAEEEAIYQRGLEDGKSVARGMERLARLSTSDAPVAPSGEAAVTGSDVLDKQVSEWRKEVARLQDLIATATGAPVTAEPVQSIDTPMFRELLANWAACRTNEALARLIAYINSNLAAPASHAESVQTRDAIRPLYTCKGKGGLYELMGVVYGAGTSRGTMVNLYREKATGVMYYRTPADFQDRMERAADAKGAQQ